MAKIKLNMSPARVTPKQSYKAPDFSGVANAMSANTRAQDYLASSLSRVGDVVQSIYKDEKQSIVQSDNIQASAKRIELSQEAIQELNQGLDEGKWQKKEDFEKVAKERLAKIDSDMKVWGKENMRYDDSMQRLEDENKLEYARNYASLMGTFIRIDGKRTVQKQESALKIAQANGNKQDGSAIIDTMSHLSQEQKTLRKNVLYNNIDTANVENRLSQIDNIIDPEARKDAYTAMITNIENGQYEGLYKAQKDKISNISTRAKNRIDTADSNQELKNAFEKDISDLADKEIDTWLGDTRKLINTQEHTSKAEKEGFLQSADAMAKRAKEVLVDNALKLKAEQEKEALKKEKEALENTSVFESTKSLLNEAKNGNINFLIDTSPEGEKRKAKQKAIDNSADYFRNAENSLEYNKNFDDILAKISSYNPKNDKGGFELQNLALETQAFHRDHRKSLVSELNRKAQGITLKGWSTEATDDFYNTIDEKVQWYDLEDGKLSEVERRTEFIQFRDSIMDEVQKLNLNPIEAKEYLNKHPIYSQLVDEQAFNDAQAFLNNIAPVSGDFGDEKKEKISNGNYQKSFTVKRMGIL